METKKGGTELIENRVSAVLLLHHIIPHSCSEMRYRGGRRDRYYPTLYAVDGGDIPV